MVRARWLASAAVGAPERARDDDGATVALVLSIIGLLGCLPVGAVGLLMGYAARERIQRSAGAVGGERTARYAIVIGWVAVSISVLALLTFAVLMAVTRGG